MAFLSMIGLLALRFEAFLAKVALIRSQLDVRGLDVAHDSVHVSKGHLANGAECFARLRISGRQFT